MVRERLVSSGDGSMSWVSSVSFRFPKAAEEGKEEREEDDVAL
jgi:hypothetical protein